MNMGENERSLLAENERLRAERDRLLAVVRFTANMPDDENMPYWAQELRYHARAALAKQEVPTGQSPDSPSVEGVPDQAVSGDESVAASWLDAGAPSASPVVEDSQDDD